MMYRGMGGGETGTLRFDLATVATVQSLLLDAGVDEFMNHMDGASLGRAWGGVVIQQAEGVRAR